MFNLNLLLFISLSAAFFCQAQDQFIVWNTGQGQWTSEVHSDFCLHFDLGGERDVSFQVLKFCQGKMNYLNLSHWDWDHISYATRYAALSRQACLIHRPAGTANFRKTKLIDQIPLCNLEELKKVSNLFLKIYVPEANQKQVDSNSLSEVVFSKSFQILIPGDSPKRQEAFWSEQIPQKAKGLVLGHHGSRTSTSKQLMNHLAQLKWAVASARMKRYGHPHHQVVELLKKEKVPLLKTEDWGHLHFLK
jgi:competence protein ComEC